VTIEIGYLAHPEGDKCYKVSEDYEGHMVLVWARFHAEARRYGANALDLEWDSVECERFPKLDAFDGDLLTWCLNDGWYFECTECEKRCGLPEHGYDGCVIERGDIFCSKEHAEKFHVRWDERKALERRFLEHAREKYPTENARAAQVNSEGDGIVYFDWSCRIISRSEIDPLP
jgi:hypothetical protein